MAFYKCNIDSPRTTSSMGVFWAENSLANDEFDIATHLSNMKSFVAYASNGNVANGTVRTRAYISWDSSNPTIYEGGRVLVNTSNASSGGVVHHSLGTRIVYTPTIMSVSDDGVVHIKLPASCAYIPDNWTWIATENTSA